ncbi:hypothetical protein F4803DRAFT_527203 [Xylaria telfairii]|nr:hypothetical protein F4803DRAFT_527203 [Xylaria telfairii]
MADQDMRLRLVVRRHGLPELRLMWHVSLDSNPSISKLLEQLNNHVPLESEHWGLEDYVVELHDTDGADFECLHYQLVRSVLKPDDRVFIRALDRDDNRRRRISGRLQISSDGRHLIDGVAFGRPNLKTPAARPPVHIPPLKRARLTYTQQDDEDLGRGNASDNDSPMLLLTNGEPHIDGHTPPRTLATADFEDADSGAEDTDYNGDDAELASSSNGSDTEGEEEEEEVADDEMEKDAEEEQNAEDEEEVEDLFQEACDLAVENATLNGRGLDPMTRTMSLETLDKVTILRAAFPNAPINLFDKVLAASRNNLKTAYNALCPAFNPQLSQAAVLAWKPGSASNRGVHPEQTRQLANPAPTRETIGRPSTRKRKFSEQSSAEESSNDEDEGHNNDLWRKYDHAGFPPGTITSGTGLSQMAAISASFESNRTNGNSEATSTTLKAAAEEQTGEDDDDTSSSGTSSDSSDTSSSGDSSDSDDTSSSGGSSDSDDTSSSGGSSDSDDTSSIAGSSDSDDDSSNGGSSVDSDESDDAGEEASSSEDLLGHSNSSDGSDLESSDDSGGGSNKSIDKVGRFQLSHDIYDNENDSGPEEYPFQKTSSPGAKDKEGDESSESSDESSASESDSQSAGADSNSDSEEDEDNEPNGSEVLTSKTIATSQPKPQGCPSSNLTQANPAPTLVPPGAGKEATKRRNARRRATIKARRKTEETNIDAPTTKGTVAGDSHVPDNEAALFEAKRKALLEAIATGGIEVTPSREIAFNHSPTDRDTIKRKRVDQGGDSPQHDQNEVGVVTDKHLGADQEPSPNEKRRRIDLAAGRRLVFGALGLRNPKNKEEEAKLRDKLQAESQVRLNRQASRGPQPTTNDVVSIENGEDLHAWKLKINYRAVECCDDNIGLSPAPFPFQQRWDPQQQALSFSKRNKRGGQSKRTQRNQAHYYNDDSQLGKKRKRGHGYEMVDDGFDGTSNGEDATDGDHVMLNYDDVEIQDHDDSNNPANETSQATDLDDLPSLPQDVSTLRILRPGEAQVGMVITWQKWSCSSATSWQPQLSRVTAIVAAVDDDAATLGVCLAKRDRYLDGNEKRYDHITGQRIYDKFEAPDLHEDEDTDDNHGDDGVNDGYRNLAWAELQDPRILQEPLDTTAGFDSNVKCIASIETDEKSISMENQTEPPAPPMVSSQQGPNAIATTSERNVVSDNSKLDVSPEGGPGEYNADPFVQATSNSISHQAGQNQQTTDSAMSDVSQISSPSRQLHETTSQAMGSHSPIQNWARTSSLGQPESPQPNTSSPMPLPATVSSRPEEDFESELVTGTPDVVLPRATIPSSTSSIRSGRQPDYAMGVDDGVLDPFDATDDIDHQDEGHSNNDAPLERSSLTPVPTGRTPTPNHNAKTDEDKDTGRSLMATPTSRLRSSPSSVFCTAVTSHSTQSPSGVQMSSAMSKPSASKAARDAKFEEAMRKLDEQFDDDLSDDESPPPPPTSSLEVKREASPHFVPQALDSISPPPKRKPSLPNAPGSRRLSSKQPNLANPTYRRGAPTPAVLSDLPSGRSSPEQSTPTHPTHRRVPSARRASKPFSIPAGSQVVELSSDSEPAYAEDYADEDVDGTYSPELGSLPRGLGWVQKRRGKARRSIV